MTQIVLHLKTLNDSNGNPRRLYLPLDPEKFNPVVYVIEEGYRGSAGLKQRVYDKYNTFDIEVPIREYNDWVRWGKENGVYIP